MLLLFSFTAFLSAGLLFLLEPMFARMILPLLGGAPSVWNSCVVFYQVVLLASYVYAHALTTHLKATGQLLVHGTMVVAAALLLPIVVSPSLVPPATVNPIGWVFRLLLVTLGLPFFVIATSGPLLQRWFASMGHRASSNPYTLYAASNLGSLLALLAYPLLIEPTMRLRTQSLTWTVGYIAFGVLTALCGLAVWRAPAQVGVRQDISATSNDLDDWWATRLRWLGLAIVPSTLMLSVTTFLSTDVAAIPLLWIVPLALYLLTFIIAFAERQIVSHWLVARLFPGAAIVIVALVLAQNAFPVVTTVAWHLFAYFVIALGCHQELAASRPSASRLTEFYLWLSAGGAIGGLFNTLVAPVIFVNAIEYPLAAIAACLLLPGTNRWPDGTAQRVRVVATTLLPVVLLNLAVYVVRQADARIPSPVAFRYIIIFLTPLLACYALRKSPVRMGLALASLIFAGSFIHFDNRVALYVERTFFGIHRVLFTGNEKLLQSGTTNHGAQSTNPALTCEPLTYYSRGGPVGQLFDSLKDSAARARIGVVGLGTATMAAYATVEQAWTFFEINPAVDRLARDPSYFTFIRDCAPDARTVLGDARLALLREPDSSFDLLVLDAFSSDAIPVHLMTREAMALYMAKLTTRGLLAVHISNRYLDLAPVVAALARSAGAVATMQFHGPSEEQTRMSAEITASRWTMIARRAEDLGSLANDTRWQPITALEGPLWTDDYSNVVRTIHW